MAGLRGDMTIEEQIKDGNELTGVDKFVGRFKGDGEKDYLTERAAANKAARLKAEAEAAARKKKIPNPY